jgi:hypothetical protein
MLAGVAALAVAAGVLASRTPAHTAQTKHLPHFVDQMREAGRGDRENESRDAAEDWFFAQRSYPSGSIPQDAVGQAVLTSQAKNSDADEADDASSHWVPLGPSTLPNGQTDQSAGGPLSPVSGRVTAIAVDPHNHNIVYAAGAQGGVWKSTNARSAKPHWTALTDHEPSLAVGSIAIDPVDSNIVYVGTGEPNRSCDSYYGRGILRSADGGATWKVLGGSGAVANNPGPFVGKAVSKVLIDPKTAGSTHHTTIWASTTIGVFTSGTIATCSVAAPAGPVGLWRSQDSGQTWELENVPAGLAGTFSVQDMVLDPTNSDILYAGVRSTGVFKSTNAASGAPATYAPAGTGFPTASSPNTPIRRINLSIGGSSNPGVLMASMEDAFGEQLWGMYKTTDGGNTWSHLDNGQNGTANLTAGSNMVAWVSGASFDPSWVGRRFIVNNQLSLTVAAVASATSLSLNVNSPATLTGATFSTGTYPTYCDGQCFYDMTLLIDPSDSSANRVYVGGNPHGFAADLSGVPGGHTNWRSDDGGITWTSVSQGNGVTGGVHTDDHAETADAQGVLYDGNDGGIWRSDDHGASWTTMNTNIAVTQFQSVGTNPFDSGLVIGGTQDNGTNIRNAALVAPPAWFHADFGDGGIAMIDQSNPSVMFHTYFNQAFNFMGPAMSSDGGAGGPGSWAFVGAYFGYGPQYYNGMNPTEPVSFYAPLTENPAFSPNVVYFGTNHLYRSPAPQPAVAGVPSWTAVSPALTKGGSAYISWIGVSPNLVSGMEVVYTGASDGRVEVSSNVTGGGVATWNIIDSTLPNRAVTQITVDPADATGNTAYIAFSGFGANTPTTPGHVFMTTNGLAASPTWTDITGDLPDLPMNQVIVVHHGKGTWVLVATDIGVFRTQNGGAHWRHLSKGLPFAAVFGLQQDPKNHRVIAATHGRGMFKLLTPN